MSAAENPQPTIADVLTELRLQRVEIGGIRSEISGLRGEFSALRSEFTTLRFDTVRRFEDLERRMDTFFDELAAFRAEYNNHTHE